LEVIMKSAVLLLLFVFTIFMSVGMAVEPAKQVKTFNKDLATKKLTNWFGKQKQWIDLQ